jgi:hypothetical protein
MTTKGTVSFALFLQTLTYFSWSFCSGHILHFAA